MAEQVMNNRDLRGVIFSFFRTKPQNVCDKYKKVCLWNDKIVNRYMEIPILDHTVIHYQCMECYWHAGTREFL